MLRHIVLSFLVALFCGLAGWQMTAVGQTTEPPTPAAAPATPGEAAPPAAAPAAAAPSVAPPPGGWRTLADAVKTPKGELKNPFDYEAATAEEGKKLYLGLSCNGCHGGGGGGGMCPPLTNLVWVYGKDDDTLFRLIALGSDDLQKAGYARKGREGVVGPMPPYVDLIDSEDKLWKVISFIRSVNKETKKQ